MMQLPEQQTVLTRRMVRQLRRVVFEVDFEWPELLNGLLLILWGAGVGKPGARTFDDVPVYRALEWLASHLLPGHEEHLWGALAISLGALVVLGLTADLYQLRRGMTFLSLGFWAFILVAYWASGAWVAGNAFLIGFVINALWVLMRLTIYRWTLD